jgi:hypothetical protein
MVFWFNSIQQASIQTLPYYPCQVGVHLFEYLQWWETYLPGREVEHRFETMDFKVGEVLGSKGH